MKLDKLFKKLETFFEMEKSEQKDNKEKKSKLKNLLAEKIVNKKQKIKISQNSEKKAKLKEELKILKKLSLQYNM